MDSKRPGDVQLPPAKRANIDFDDSAPDIEEDYLQDQDVDITLDDDQFMRDAELESRGLLSTSARIENWKRPSPDAVDPKTDSIVFQQLEIDYVIGHSPKEVLSQESQSAILRIYGVTEKGNSVCALVYGFQPYLYVCAPPGFAHDDLEPLKRTLEAHMKNVSIVKVELKKKQSVMHYQPSKSAWFIKITTALPTMVATCRGFLEKGSIPYEGFYQPMLTYESNILYVLRFMIDCKISGGNWIELPAGKYHQRQHPMTWCQLEFDIRYDELVSHPPVGRFSKMAPFRILSFDIECQGRKGRFPEPEHDPVITIGNLVTEQGAEKPMLRNVMTLKQCAPIAGVEVMSFEREAELLESWKELVKGADPDIIIGYNICKFDLPYLIGRAKTLGVGAFEYLGRVRNSKFRMRETTFSSRQYGTRESFEVTIEGRVQLDLFQAIQRDHKLSSYSLNSVSAHFLNEQKEDVHHSIIAELQRGTPETRRRLAVYCLKDAYLPQRLLDKLKYIFNYVEMARVTGVPLSFLLSRGQSIKVLSQILRKAQQRGLVVPNMKAHAGSGAETYEGATVLEAKQAYYEKPIATLDFASLYPSIMMAYNLCYCTLVPRSEVAKLGLPEEMLTKTPAGDTFVKSELTKGILPEILEELLAARKIAKTDLKAATDPFERAVLDGRQLALKVSANSVYGFTGATVGALPCLEISSSVTAYGREMIERTQTAITDTYTMEKGYQHDAEVVYGDTDSVMVQFGVSEVGEAMKLGRDAADRISRTFPKPIKLEFEKVYYPYLLISKKRYAGLYWSNPNHHDKMDTKGIETVRRDNCLLVKNLVTECLHRILIDRDTKGAVDFVKATIADLLMNRIDLSLLVITKGLTKSEDEDGNCDTCKQHTSGGPPCPRHYGNKSAHVELALRMRKRDAATAPTLGDRVPYVIIKGPKGAKAYEKSEDPIFVLENNIPVDAHYYLENQLSKPLLRIFGPILKNASRELLHGDHTRAVSILTPSTGGLMRFAKVKLLCLACKTPLSDASKTVCKDCEAREDDLYMRSVHNVAVVEESFNRLWRECQRCQGSLHQDVLCTSRDCPIFYRRKKAQKDWKEAESQLSRFTVEF